MHKLLAAMAAATFLLTACDQSAPPKPPKPIAHTGQTAQPAPTTPAVSSPAASSPILSADGVGPIRFGMKLDEAETAISEKSHPLGGSDPECRLVTFDALPLFRFMVEKNVVTRADAMKGAGNVAGVDVGDDPARVKEKFASVQVGPHKYLPAGHYLAIRGGGDNALIMEDDGKAIIKIRGGMEPAVSYVESCG